MHQPDIVSEQIKTFIFGQFPLARTNNVTNDRALLESGILDSLGILDIVTFIEATYEINVIDDDLIPENFQTINHIVEFIKKKLESF